VKGNSRYPEPYRELLAGAKQQGNSIELAPELPSETVVGPDEGPSLSGQDIGTIAPVSGLKKSGSSVLRLFWRRFFYRISQNHINKQGWIYRFPAECIPKGIKKSGTAENQPSVSLQKRRKVF